MFSISANHLALISRTEYPSYAVLLMRDRDTQRVYRLYDFSKAQLIRPILETETSGRGAVIDGRKIVELAMARAAQIVQLRGAPCPASAIRSGSTGSMTFPK